MNPRSEIERLKEYYINIKRIGDEFKDDLEFIDQFIQNLDPVSYTHLTLPTTPYV